jgi:predicted RNA-binding Zn-ribbon protein involved in translation (DUF1610 family)
MLACEVCTHDISYEINNYMYACLNCGHDIPYVHTCRYEAHLFNEGKQMVLCLLYINSAKLTCLVAAILRKERMMKVSALEYAQENLKEGIRKIKEESRPNEDTMLTPYERAVIRDYEDASCRGFPFTGTMTPPPVVQGTFLQKGKQMMLCLVYINSANLTCLVAELLRQDRMMKLWALEYALEKLNDEIAKIKETYTSRKEDTTLSPYMRAYIRKDLHHTALSLMGNEDIAKSLSTVHDRTLESLNSKKSLK